MAMKGRMKRWLAAGLCCVLWLGMTACGEEVKKSGYQQALDAIAKEDYDAAYALLKESKDRRAAEELKKFVFVPVKHTFKNSNGTDNIYQYTYDALGNLLQKKTTYTGGEYLHKYTYSGYKMMSYYYQNSGYVYAYKYIYDSAGNRVQEWHLDRNGDWIGKTTYTYNEQNLCLSKETINKENAQDMTPELAETRYYTYDGEGRVLSDEHTCYYEGEVLEKYTIYYTYEQDGSYCEVTHSEGSDSGLNLVSTTYYDADGKVLKGERRTDEEPESYTTYEYRYNARGDVEYYHEYYAPNETEKVTLYEYDDQGHLLKKETTDQAGETTYIECNTYDEAGNRLTHEKVDMAVNSWYKEVSIYDEQNRLLTQKDDYDGGWANTTYTYDDRGNVIKEEQESCTGSYTETFTYDEWGNAISSFRYRVETIGETAIEETALWDLLYYPEGIPENVQQVIESAEIY